MLDAQNVIAAVAGKRGIIVQCEAECDPPGHLPMWQCTRNGCPPVPGVGSDSRTAGVVPGRGWKKEPVKSKSQGAIQP